ncbi:Predicted nuclease, contains PIN domain, potential toxin-antitoxin system component [Chitinophaga jiangningensis]|uniref:Predicted nuclease, contains PIN domain, potential toxin-antitoxin system component n=1 Tax=Chitinophaga jiangningensis TaxID=1419482 RepID=A0A1M7HDW5_9BACT|nr:DUF5615 family PIN-like protein [Chitinophaga jiangningensis]SHM26660.1 Predicted nuclease, contains PIN domain, potential toxin-antitoxin system component [Chitinophaga jiangningensis]
MILADENIHTHIVQFLRENGFEVVSITELNKGIKDEEVIQWALKNDYFLLTEDKDFGEWVFAHHVKDLSVLFLRYAFYEYEEIAEALVILLKSTQLKKPVFATLTPKKIRVRQL